LQAGQALAAVGQGAQVVHIELGRHLGAKAAASCFLPAICARSSVLVNGAKGSDQEMSMLLTLLGRDHADKLRRWQVRPA